MEPAQRQNMEPLPRQNKLELHKPIPVAPKKKLQADPSKDLVKEISQKHIDPSDESAHSLGESSTPLSQRKGELLERTEKERKSSVEKVDTVTKGGGPLREGEKKEKTGRARKGARLETDARWFDHIMDSTATELRQNFISQAIASKFFGTTSSQDMEKVVGALKVFIADQKRSKGDMDDSFLLRQDLVDNRKSICNFIIELKKNGLLNDKLYQECYEIFKSDKSFAIQKMIDNWHTHSNHRETLIKKSPQISVSDPKTDLKTTAATLFKIELPEKIKKETLDQKKREVFIEKFRSDLNMKSLFMVNEITMDEFCQKIEGGNQPLHIAENQRFSEAVTSFVSDLMKDKKLELKEGGAIYRTFIEMADYFANESTPRNYELAKAILKGCSEYPNFEKYACEGAPTKKEFVSKNAKLKLQLADKNMETLYNECQKQGISFVPCMALSMALLDNKIQALPPSFKNIDPMDKLELGSTLCSLESAIDDAIAPVLKKTVSFEYNIDSIIVK